MQSAIGNDLESAFRTETNRLLAERIPVAAIAFIIIFGVAWVIEHHIHPDRDVVYAITFGAEITSFGLVLQGLQTPRGQAYARAIIVLLTVVLLALVACYHIALRAPAEIMVMAQLYLIVGALVALPLGWQGQLPLALVAILSLPLAVAMGATSSVPVSMQLLGVIGISLLSLSGAGYLQRQRYEAFRKTEEARRANQAFEQTNQFLADANRAKNEFLAGVSHELRTPLNIILGYAALLGEGEFGPLEREAQTVVERIHRNCQTLAFLISDLLDLSRIEAGRLTLYPQAVDLAAVFEELRRFVEPRLRQDDVVFDTELAEDLRITTDPNRLEQILINLLSNAIKFTRRGRITLRGFPDGGNKVIFEVKDTGVGIDPDDMPTLFQPFRQGSAGKEAGGVGIGLSLSFRLASAMNGRLWVQSKIEQGSTFTLELPGSA